MHLPDNQLQTVREILKKIIPEIGIIAFGSRVHGNNLKPFSDLDLCLMTDKPINIQLLGKLKDAFSESDLPIKVDLVDWSTAEPPFKKIIQEQSEKIQ